MGMVTMTLEEYNALRAAAGFGMVAGNPSQMIPATMELNSPISVLPAPKKKRKVSAYSRAYGAAYRRLKAKHPRSQHKTLVKRAHAEARRKTKKKK